MDNNIDANYEYLQEQQMMLEEPQEQAVEGDDVESLSQTQGEEAIDDDDQGMMGDSVFANVGQGLEGNYRNMMMAYWQETINSIEHEDHDFRNHQLPLARIKKVMKTDEEVRMISAEAPILFAKGCDIFITELTMRAWIHAEENKRRTLQRSDIAAALQKSDMFDFLIDIVPREEPQSTAQSSYQKKNNSVSGSVSAAASSSQYYESERPQEYHQHYNYEQHTQQHQQQGQEQQQRSQEQQQQPQQHQQLQHQS